MPITADYHLHSSFSGDSDTPMEEMIQKGIALGLTRMCFTEHHDLDYPVTESTPAGFFELNPDACLYDFLKLKEKYADRITLCFGVELGMQPHLARRNAAFSKAHDYDSSSPLPTCATGRIPIIRPSMRAGARTKPIWNILRRFRQICRHLITSMSTAIWTMWCAMAPRRMRVILMRSTGISSNRSCSA